MYKKLLFFTAMLSIHLLPVQAPIQKTHLSHTKKNNPRDVTISHSGENFVGETDIKCTITLDEIEQLQKIDGATKSIKASELIFNAIVKKIPTSIAINCPENPEYNLIIQITFTPDTVQSETKTTINVYKTPKILPTLADLLITHALHAKKGLSKYAKIGLGVAVFAALLVAKSKINERAERRNNNLKNWLFPTPSETEKESAKVRIAQKINTDLNNTVAIPLCPPRNYGSIGWLENFFLFHEETLAQYIKGEKKTKIILLISCSNEYGGTFQLFDNQGGAWDRMIRNLTDLYKKIPRDKFHFLFIDLETEKNGKEWSLGTALKKWLEHRAQQIKHNAIHIFYKVKDEQIDTLFKDIKTRLNLT